jgi:excisionase family DNA binding protein
MSADDLLHRVDVRRISTNVQRQILELVRQAVREELAEKRQKPPGAALRAREAARHIGVGSTKFYELLAKDPALAGLAFRVGKDRRWPREALDRWMESRQQGTTIRNGDPPLAEVA